MSNKNIITIIIFFIFLILIYNPIKYPNKINILKYIKFYFFLYMLNVKYNHLNFKI